MAKKQVATNSVTRRAATKTAVKKGTKRPVKKQSTTQISRGKPPATAEESAALAREALRLGSRSKTVAAKRGNRKFQPITEPMEKADISRGREQSTRDDEKHSRTRHKKTPHRRRAALRG
jgi:hypothetical protein